MITKILLILLPFFLLASPAVYLSKHAIQDQSFDLRMKNASLKSYTNRLVKTNSHNTQKHRLAAELLDMHQSAEEVQENLRNILSVYTSYIQDKGSVIINDLEFDLTKVQITLKCNNKKEAIESIKTLMDTLPYNVILSAIDVSQEKIITIQVSLDVYE